jgi:hypothetical protein
LFDEREDRSAAGLSIRVTQDSMSAVAGTVVEQAQTAARKLSHSLVVAKVSDAVTNAADAALNQQNLITSFDALMKKLGVVVNAGDELRRFALQYPHLLRDLS